MADSDAAPRRSHRDRKQVKPFASTPQSKPANQPGDDDSLTELSDTDDTGDDHDAVAEHPHDEQDFTASKSKKRAAPPRKSKGPAKKPRTAKSTAAPSKRDHL